MSLHNTVTSQILRIAIAQMHPKPHTQVWEFPQTGKMCFWATCLLRPKHVVVTRENDVL